MSDKPTMEEMAAVLARLEKVPFRFLSEGH